MSKSTEIQEFIKNDLKENIDYKSIAFGADGAPMGVIDSKDEVHIFLGKDGQKFSEFIKSL